MGDGEWFCGDGDICGKFYLVCCLDGFYFNVVRFVFLLGVLFVLLFEIL